MFGRGAVSGGARVRRSAGRPGDGRRASGAAALHSVRYNERSRTEVLPIRAPLQRGLGAPVFRPVSLPAGERNSHRHSPPRRAAAKPHTATPAEARATAERRSPTGIAAREGRETAYSRVRRSAGTAWNAGLRPAPMREAQRKPRRPKPPYGAQQERRSSFRPASLPAGNRKLPSPVPAWRSRNPD